MTTYSQNPPNTQPPETFQNWASRGYTASLIPVVFGEKRPALIAWQTHTATIGHIQAWDSKTYNIGLQTAKFPCLDIDCSNLKVVKQIHTAIGETFKQPVPLRFRGYPRCAVLFKLDPAADLMTKMTRTYFHPVTGESFTLEMLGDGQQVVIDGKHPSQEWYRWEQRRPPVDELPVMNPLAFNNMFTLIDKKLLLGGYRPKDTAAPRGRQSAKTSEYGPYPPEGHEDLVVDLFRILPFEMNHDKWINFSIAVKASAPDMEWDAKFKEPWLEWSGTAQEKRDPDYAWDNQLKPDGRAGFGTVLEYAKNCKDPKVDKWLAKALKARRDVEVKSAYEDFDDIEESDHLTYLNERYGVYMGGDTVRIIGEPLLRGLAPRYLKKADFLLETAPLGQVLDTQLRTVAGKPRLVPAAEAWVRSPSRTEYVDQGMYIDTPVPDKHYNHWHGWRYDPKPGCCDLYKAHMLDIVCDGNQEAYDYIWNWFAWKLQNPAKLVGTAIVLQGDEGTGKTKLFEHYWALFAPYTRTIKSKRALVGNFNAHLEKMLVIGIEEAHFAGDREAADMLKSMLTDPGLPVERKGVDVREAPNRLGILMTTNHDHAVHITTGNRRHMVLAINESKKEDIPYFAAIDVEMLTGGREALMYELLQTDVSGWNANPVPMTDAKLANIIQSLDETRAWAYHILDTATLPNLFGAAGEWPDHTEEVSANAVREHFKNFHKGAGMHVAKNTQAQATQLGMFVRKAFGVRRVRQGAPKVGQKGRSYVYVFPAIDAARACFQKYTKLDFGW